MKFFFRNTIAGNVDSAVVLDDLMSVEKEWKESTKPMLDTLVSSMRGAKYGKGPITDIYLKVCRELDTSRDPVDVLQRHLAGFEDKLVATRGLIQSEVGRTVTQATSNYRIANIIESARMFGFVSRYTRTLIVGMLHEVNGTEEATSRTHAESGLYVKERQLPYKNSLRTLVLPTDEFVTKMRKVPTIDLVDESKLQAIGVGRMEVDPFSMGLFPVSLNPFYSLGRKLVEFQHNRYETAKRERLLAEQHIELYKSRLGGNDDAQLEKAIEYYTKEVNSQRYKVERYEERYGI